MSDRPAARDIKRVGDELADECLQGLVVVQSRMSETGTASVKRRASPRIVAAAALADALLSTWRPVAR